MNFDEFVEKLKHEPRENSILQEDYQVRKNQWIKAVNDLYEYIDLVLVRKLINAGVEVFAEKENVLVYEDYIGSYMIENYVIKINHHVVKFNPIGTIIIDACGKINLLLPKDTIKLVLKNWTDWKIVTGFGDAIQLIDFNENNLLALLQENL